MKTILYAISTVLFLFLSAKADLISVTATGTIVEFGHSTNGVPFNPGTDVSYTFEFDTGEIGYQSYTGGTIQLSDQNISNANTSYNRHYFYADFVGNFVMPDYVQPNILYNFGYTDNGISTGGSLLRGGSKTHLINFYSDENIDNWGVGTLVYGDEFSFLSNGGLDYTYSNLTITDISKINVSQTSVPVPESSTFAMILFGLTILGIFGTLRRREN